MKKSALIAALLVLTVLFCFQAAMAENPYQADPMSVPSGYDPASEEEDDYYVGGTFDAYNQKVYAGASPIPLDPINLPEPTPRPGLEFTYEAVTADNIRLTFEKPVGWYMDATEADSVTLTDPNMYEGVNATMTIRFQSVPNSFKLADVKTELANILKEIGQYNYIKWETKIAAERTLLQKNGYYNNYSGEYYDGTVVSGRVMVALMDDGRIIVLHMMCPGHYNDSYMKVVNQFRNTVKQF